MFNRSLALLVAAPFFVVSCSKSGSSSGVGSNNSVGGFGSTITSQFIDAPVKGLKFKNEAGEISQTGEEGKFSCKRGELIQFTLGGLDLGYASCGQKIYVHDLASEINGYGWEKAAAVIQSFSVTNAGVLDLSVVNQETLDLSGLAYTGSFDAELINTHSANASSLPTSGTAPVSTSVAASEANNALVADLQLPSQLELVLSGLASLGEKKITLQGTLVSGTTVEGEEWCGTSIDARATVSTTVETNLRAPFGVYTFSVDQAATYNGSAEASIDEDGVCLPENGDCEMASEDKLPKPKIITGLKTDMIFSRSYADSDIQGSISERNILSLDMKINNDEVNVSGVFNSVYEVTSGPALGEKYSCRYSVSTGIAVDTGEDEGPAQSPVNGLFQDMVQCYDGNSTPLAPVAANASVVVQGGKVTSYEVSGDENFATSFSGNISFVFDPEKNHYEATHTHEDFEVSAFPMSADTLLFDIMGLSGQGSCYGTLLKD